MISNSARCRRRWMRPSSLDQTRRRARARVPAPEDDASSQPRGLDAPVRSRGASSRCRSAPRGARSSLRSATVHLARCATIAQSTPSARSKSRPSSVLVSRLGSAHRGAAAVPPTARAMRLRCARLVEELLVCPTTLRAWRASASRARARPGMLSRTDQPRTMRPSPGAVVPVARSPAGPANPTPQWSRLPDPTGPACPAGVVRGVPFPGTQRSGLRASRPVLSAGAGRFRASGWLALDAGAARA
jgi:hypothetical protein